MVSQLSLYLAASGESLLRDTEREWLRESLLLDTDLERERLLSAGVLQECTVKVTVKSVLRVAVGNRIE